ncbi:MAG: hypothetical protein ACYDAN_09585 [Candidatus Limnocylindrales bacterium]
MRRSTGAVAAVGSLVVLGGLATTFLPSVIWPDSPAPASVAASVPAARWQLWTEATDGLRLPLHLTFTEARCGADGSVGLIFEEHRPPSTERRFAYAARGSMPSSADNAWSGGYGISGSVLDDDEFIHLLGPNPPVCAS